MSRLVVGWLDENCKPFERVDLTSTILAGNGSELKSARLRWSAALKSGGLPGCSNKKSSDQHHGKPFSMNVKLILFISGSSRRGRRPRRLRPPCVSVIHRCNPHICESCKVYFVMSCH